MSTSREFKNILDAELNRLGQEASDEVLQKQALLELPQSPTNSLELAKIAVKLARIEDARESIRFALLAYGKLLLLLVLLSACGRTPAPVSPSSPTTTTAPAASQPTPPDYSRYNECIAASCTCSAVNTQCLAACHAASAACLSYYPKP